MNLRTFQEHQDLFTEISAHQAIENKGKGLVVCVKELANIARSTDVFLVTSDKVMGRCLSPSDPRKTSYYFAPFTDEIIMLFRHEILSLDDDWGIIK